LQNHIGGSFFSLQRVRLVKAGNGCFKSGKLKKKKKKKRKRKKEGGSREDLGFPDQERKVFKGVSDRKRIRN